MNGLDLFSGIGGITKALEGYVRPVAYCENDRYAMGVLLSRMATGDLPVAPIWDDVTTLRGDSLPTPIDIIYGGFPCQDISVAGRGAGLDGKRSGLFFEIVRLVSDIRPSFVFLENVSAITGRGLGRVVGEFCLLGYDTRWETLCASEVGCPMHGHRWFMLAAPSKPRLQSVAKNTISQSSKREVFKWPATPEVRRMVDGIPNGLDRIKCLGNAVVPAQAREAFERLMGLKNLAREG